MIFKLQLHNDVQWLEHLLLEWIYSKPAVVQREEDTSKTKMTDTSFVSIRDQNTQLYMYSDIVATDDDDDENDDEVFSNSRK